QPNGHERRARAIAHAVAIEGHGHRRLRHGPDSLGLLSARTKMRGAANKKAAPKGSFQNIR
ncbi:MAG: hypothetical protein E6417_40955, partial [Bradyrhizobium sp.]|nr:hypothetical protein [Bradyrhizobium sp.]